MAQNVVAIPEVSQDEFATFHKAHFSALSTNHFAEQFLGPVDLEEEYFEADEDDDGLGYYEDGVKRTLTDEQIAIFRHSEIQTLLRELRNSKNGEVADINRYESSKSTQATEEGELNEGPSPTAQIQPARIPTPPSDRVPSETGQSLSRKEKKAKQARDKGWFRQHVKPDLRKRTWDKVDKGMGSLDYDEDSTAATNKPAFQRRKISYDD